MKYLEIGTRIKFVFIALFASRSCCAKREACTDTLETRLERLPAPRVPGTYKLSHCETRFNVSSWLSLDASK